MGEITMLSFNNLYTVARYETKTLLRSWFFRIFAGLSITILIITNLIRLTNPQSADWNYKAIDSIIPYFNILILNTIQAIIAIFLASDFMKRDKKLDTTEVIYVRPMSNFEYVVGKTIGILGVFMVLNILIMLMSAIFQFTLADVSFSIAPIIYYPLLISLPTLIYILGLAFLLMLIFKNQAITFLVLLGYVALTIFVIGKEYHNLFDYMAYSLPLLYSDIVGFGNGSEILIHRGIYLLAGLAFISITFSALNRLPQAGNWSRMGYVVGGLLLGASGFLTWVYISSINNEATNRTTYLETNNSFAHLPVMDVQQMNLSLNHLGNSMEVTGDMEIRNRSGREADSVVFSLNPDLEITEITIGEKPANYKRIHQSVVIIPDTPLKNNRQLTLNFAYKGTIDESVAYLDVDSALLDEKRWINLANIDKRHAFLTPNYTLLTSEIIWYPTSGVTYNNSDNNTSQPDFFNFTLKVNGINEQIAYSQGVKEKIDGGFKFTSEHPYSQISLAIGNYEEKSIEVDAVNYRIAYIKGHDFFSGFFDLMGDTMTTIIKKTKDDYETQIDLYYPFKQLTLVEVPIQFHTYKHVLGGLAATVQPEFVFLPEKGMGLRGADFARSQYREQSRNRNNQTVLPIETQIKLFNRFAYSTFFSGMTRTSNMMRGGSGDASISVDMGNSSAIENPYAIFPQYYNYMVSFSTTTLPAFNSIIEEYLKEGFSVSGFRQMQGGMTDIERANLAIQKGTLSDIINTNTSATLVDNVVKQKGHYLISILKKRIGSLNFDNFLYFFLEDNRFSVITIDAFINQLNREYNFDCRPLIKEWDTFKSVPGYLISQPVYYEVNDAMGVAYVIKYKITNTENANGIITTSIRTGGSGGRFGGSSNEDERIFELAPNETKDISILTYDAPRMLTISTIISKNIPATMSYFMRTAEPNSNGIVAENSENIATSPVLLVQPGELIVDNESADFSISSDIKISPIKKYVDSFKTIDEEDEYHDIDRRRAPKEWEAVTQSALFGEHIRSAVYVHGGNGDQTATWKTKIPQKGYYDLYTYIPTSALVSRGRGRGPSFSEEGKTYNYTLTQGGKPEEISFLMNNINDGWNFIGTYHLSADSIAVELTNKSDAGKVIADAIKFIKRTK